MDMNLQKIDSFQDNVWTTGVVSYDSTATITALEAMSPTRTGIINVSNILH